MAEESGAHKEPAYLTYSEFGQRFFEHAVTEARIVSGLARIAGEPISFGPIGAGPARVARVSAEGAIGSASAEPIPGEEIAFRLEIPVGLDLVIDLGVDQHRFRAEVAAHLTLRARAAMPLRIVIEVEPPRGRDVTVAVEAGSRRATLLKHAAGIDREIARFVAKYIRRELDKPRILEARDIDVAARIDGAWKA